MQIFNIFAKKSVLLKVVHIVEALGGGVHSYFKDLSFFFGDESVRTEVDTTIIYSGNRDEILPDKIHEEFSKGVTLLNVDMAKGISPLKDFASVIKLRSELKRLAPDIIHLHSSKAGVLGRIAFFLIPGSKAKLFYTPHGYAFLRHDISGLSRKLYRAIEVSFQMIFGGQTLACGDTEYQIARGIGKARLVRNGINIQKMRENYKPHSNPILTIGIAGRITYARNPELFNNIALRFPNYEFVWIGDGELNRLLSAPNIRITGWKFDHVSVLQELNKIDIYIQTSLWEGLPIALLEAMSLQKPILATNVIGNKDIVVSGETGFLFDEINELDHFIEVLSDPENRHNFGERALKRCTILFDRNKNLSQLIQEYRQ